MRTRGRLLVAAVIVVAAVAASCGGSDSGAGGTVRFMVFGDPPEIRAYRTLIQAFEKEHPDTGVQLVEASDRQDLLARLSTAFAGGSPPDLFLVNYRFYGQYAARACSSRWRASRGVGDARPRRLLPGGAGGVPLGGRADLPAPERLEPGRLLQPRPLPPLQRAGAAQGLDVARVRGGRAAADS